MNENVTVVPDSLLRDLITNSKILLSLWGSAKQNEPGYISVATEVHEAEALLYAPAEGSVPWEEAGAPTDEELERWADAAYMRATYGDDFPVAWPDHDPADY